MNIIKGSDTCKFGASQALNLRKVSKVPKYDAVLCAHN